MSGDVMDELNASGELWPEPKTEDGAATPRATPTTTPVAAGGELAAESATGVGAPEAAPSSHAALRDRIEDAMDAKICSCEGCLDDARDRVDSFAFGATEVKTAALINLVLAFQQIQARVITGPEKRVAAECIEAARRIYGGGQ